MSGRGLPVRFAMLREAARYPATLLFLCLVLLGISLGAIRSASLTPEGTLMHYAGRQVIWAGLGVVVFVVASFLPYQRLGRRWILVFGAGILALLAVFVIGTRVNGARRWFSLGPIRAQPSEVMKYILVIALAHAVARRGAGMRTWGGLIEAGVITSIPMLLVLLQPDLGTALTYIPIVLAIVIAGGARWKHLGMIGLGGIAAAPVMWAFVLRDYQKLRILSFLDSSGHAVGGAYQVNQSLLAVGSGGLFGRGYMQGTQGTLGFLPERHTDFIYAVICEDFGLMGGLCVLAIYGYLLCTLAKIARETRDVEGRLLCVGVGAITTMQILVNVGMALGVMPVTGLTLPLVSYGGSSLVASMFGFGLVASVARHKLMIFGRAR
jgi:rod shape determining protein RodA